MNTEFFTALELLEKEEGIPQDYMIEKIEAALVSAFKKEYGNNTNVRVHIDPAKKDVKVFQQKPQYFPLDIRHYTIQVINDLFL